MSTPSFSLLYDYRCPFARNVHEHLLVALDQGLDVKVTFEPFTLNQGHVEPGQPAVWDDPAHAGTLIALEVSVAVRDAFPDSFPALHALLFNARHEQGIALTQRDQITPLLVELGLDPDAVYAIVDEGSPRSIIAERWTHFHDDLDVFGVPTFVFDDSDATFVRLMNGPDIDNPQGSVAVIEELLGLIASRPEINELKHTRLER